MRDEIPPALLRSCAPALTIQTKEVNKWKVSISASKDLFNISERTIFAKVKSSIYYILFNLTPVINREGNVWMGRRSTCIFESFANWCSWLYLISLHSPAFDVSLLVPYHFAEFGIKDRILTKVSASKVLPNHVKSFLENRAITPPF